MEQLQSHIWLTASSYITKCSRISSYIRTPFLRNDFATAPFRISLYMRKILFSFLSVRLPLCRKIELISALSLLTIDIFLSSLYIFCCKTIFLHLASCKSNFLAFCNHLGFLFQILSALVTVFSKRT